ncbi:MAG TPA: efflux RND transporter periplasmic adaptor subunit [Thermoanaerobaculia bacterium]
MRTLTRTLAVLMMTVALFGCGGDEPATAANATTTAATTTEAPPLPADVAGVTASATPATTAADGATSTATAEGNILVATGEFISPVRSELSPKVPGRVARTYVQEGTRVSKGQPVLELESDYIRINLQAAQAEMARAKAAMDEASRDLDRKRDLIAKDSIPKATFDRSQAVFDQTSAAYQAAQAQASLLRQQLADSTLRSPVAGVVAEKRTDVGQRLGDGGIAFVVVQLSPLKLRFAVPERYLGKIKVGDKVAAKVDPYPNEVFEGTVTTLGGVIDPRTRTMFAEAQFGNGDGRLRPGLFARVETKID